MRSPRFRRDPFVREVALDPGRASAPRMTAPHMLPSTDNNGSAPAKFSLSWLNPTPHTIAVYASPLPSPTDAQHSLAGGRYPLPAPDFHRLDRASFAWRTLSPCYLAVMAELSPCYAPVPRATAFFDQPSENKRLSADSQGQNPPRNREKKGDNREKQAANREKRRGKQSGECRARKRRLANPSTLPKR